MVLISSFVCVCVCVCVSVSVCVSLCGVSGCVLGGRGGGWGGGGGGGGGVGGAWRITSLNHFNFSQCLFSLWAERRENLLHDLNDSSLSFGMK